MDKVYIYNILKTKYPELAYYINNVGERQRNQLYRESFLYMRLSQEYIVELLAKKNGLAFMERNKDIPDMYSYRTLYSFLEELYQKGCLSTQEKNMHDSIRRYASASLHRGMDETYLKKIWNGCYESLFCIVSPLLDDADYHDMDTNVYTEGDFLLRLQEEFTEEERMNNDFIQATNIFLNRIKLNIMDANKARDVVDYYIQAIQSGTLPMLAVTYAIKISQK